jgi:hypothetical protein
MLTFSDTTAICELFTGATGIVVTEGARWQITLLINCLETDRHETWDPELRHDRLQNYFQDCKRLLPVVLGQVAEDHHLQTRISTIDIVYWTGRNLEDLWEKICPLFPRRSEQPEYMLAIFPWTLGRVTELKLRSEEAGDAEIP